MMGVLSVAQPTLAGVFSALAGSVRNAFAQGMDAVLPPSKRKGGPRAVA